MTRGLWRKTFNVSFPRPGCMFRGNPPCGRLHPLTETYQVAEQFKPRKISTRKISNQSTVQMFTGDLRGSRRFSLQYLWKRAVRITEKPYTHQRERLCMYALGKPCNIYRLRENPSLWFLQPFSIDIAGKTYRHPVNPCKHLQCRKDFVILELLLYCCCLAGTPAFIG